MRSKLLRHYADFIVPIVVEGTTKPVVQTICQSILFHDLDKMKFLETRHCRAKQAAIVGRINKLIRLNRRVRPQQHSHGEIIYLASYYPLTEDSASGLRANCIRLGCAPRGELESLYGPRGRPGVGGSSRDRAAPCRRPRGVAIGTAAPDSGFDGSRYPRGAMPRLAVAVSDRRSRSHGDMRNRRRTTWCRSQTRNGETGIASLCCLSTGNGAVAAGSALVPVPVSRLSRPRPFSTYARTDGHAPWGGLAKYGVGDPRLPNRFFSAQAHFPGTLPKNAVALRGR
jgi:hypothetical protein